MKNYIYIFLCLAIFTTGCLKKKTDQEVSKKSFFTKLKKKKPASSDENLEAFALEDDSLRDFAQQQRNVPKPQSTPSNSTKKASSLFKWEDIESDSSKEQFKTLYFQFDKYKLASDQIKNLNADIDFAQKMISTNKIIVIEGHACHSAGSAIYNMALSEKRARYIAQKFFEKGIDKSKIKVAARGQEMPIVKGGDKNAQSVNRRVEIFAING